MPSGATLGATKPMSLSMRIRVSTNMAGADGSWCRTHSVVVEIKYLLAQNVVIHTENCKLELLLDYLVTQVEKSHVSERLCKTCKCRV